MSQVIRDANFSKALAKRSVIDIFAIDIASKKARMNMLYLGRVKIFYDSNVLTNTFVGVDANKY